MSSSQTKKRRAVGRSGLLLSGAALVIAVGVVAVWPTTRPAPGSHHYTLKMLDYAYKPAHMNWKVGETVTITLVNDSVAHPGKPHEWMVGRFNKKEPTVFGPALADGFKIPFFEGVTIKILGGSGLNMLMAGGAHLTGVKPMDVLKNKMAAMKMANQGAMTAKKMAARDTTPEVKAVKKGQKSPMTQMAETHGTTGAGSQATNGKGGMKMGEKGGMAGMQMASAQSSGGGREGFMPVLSGTGKLTIQFKVPDKPGKWSYGCFQQSGQHFLNGMRGTITVEKG